MDVFKMVETGIYHEKVVSQDNKMGIDDLNAKHKIYNMLGYELVEIKEVPAGSVSTTFSNLNGDEDEEYLVEYDITTSTSGKDLFIYPNSDQGNIQFTYNLASYNQANPTCGNPVVSKMQLAYTGQGALTICIGKCNIFPKTGRKRPFINTVYNANSNIIIETQFGLWNNIVDNITSLSIYVDSGGTFSGKIRLWKRIPLE